MGVGVGVGVGEMCPGRLARESTGPAYKRRIPFGKQKVPHCGPSSGKTEGSEKFCCKRIHSRFSGRAEGGVF